MPHILNVSLDNEYITHLIKNHFKNHELTTLLFSSLLHSDLSNQLDGGSWTELLTAKYFGLSDPYSGKILDGRWANTEVPYMTPDFLAEEGVDPDHTFFPKEEGEW